MKMEEKSVINDDKKMDEIMLPGFRFHPTDEELVGFYLKRKIQEKPISIELIKPLDIYKHDPWDLPMLATTGEKEWYFYCRRDRKYRNSTRPNRVTGAGFWKATGTDRPIYSSDGSRCIGLKKSLVFYKGRAAQGFKTDWMMHEFRLPSTTEHNSLTKRSLEKNIPPNELWAICRIFKKATASARRDFSRSCVSPIQPQSPSPIDITQYENEFYHLDHKPFSNYPTPPTLTNNNDTNNLFSIHEPILNATNDALFNFPPSIFEEFGKESLDYMINIGEQQYFNNDCFSIQERLGSIDQDQERTSDIMFQNHTNIVYFDDQWEFSNTNNRYI